MQKYNKILIESGELTRRRSEQHKLWMWSYVEERLLTLVHSSRSVALKARALEAAVLAGQLPPGTAADSLIDAFLHKLKS